MVHDRRSVLGLGAAATLLPAMARAADRGRREIWFIRHAESIINVPHATGDPAKDDGRDDGVKYPLTLKGMGQARALAQRLSGSAPAAIYASTRLRAIQTADAIAFASNRDIRLAPPLVEVSFGQPSPSSGTGTVSAVMDILRGWLVEGKPGLRAPGGESYEEVRARALPFLTHVIQQETRSGQPLILVTHGALIALIAPLVFRNITPDFCFRHLLANTQMVKGVWSDRELLCTEWAGQAI